MKKGFLIICFITLSSTSLLLSQVPATPIQITGYGGVTPYRSDLNYWTGIWQAPQALYDRGGYQDHPDYWYHTDAHEGSTWYNNVSGYGVLIVDLNQLRTINTFKVFQMFSDGKITGIQIFRNSEYTGSTAPNYSSGGWVEVTSGLTTVGTGTNNTTYISNPTSISVSDFQTRYIMLYAYNNGAYSYSSYIELKGIKAFYNNSGSYSINYMRSGPGAPLPIILESFNAECNRGSVEVNWVTASEINNNFFIIEKSNDASMWSPVAKIEGAGNSNQPRYYSYIETEVINEVTYYRLKQIDYDGTVTQYNPVAVKCSKSCTDIKVYPNPARNYVMVTIPGCNVATISLNDISGKKIFTTISTEGSATIDVSVYDKGIYFLTVCGEAITESHKIVIE